MMSYDLMLSQPSVWEECRLNQWLRHVASTDPSESLLPTHIAIVGKADSQEP
jgi:hypothetical protein